MSIDQGYELSWDSPIEVDAPEYVVVPEGDYEFEVIEFERARHPGSANLPPCNKAILHIDIKNDLGKCVIKHNLFLHSKVEGLLSAFFVSIGQKKKGERVTMNWNAVVGARGRARVGIRKYVDSNGNEREINEIKRFLAPDQAAAPATGKPTTYQPGSF